MYKFITDPRQIERKSMEIIAELLADRVFPPEAETVIKRIVHTTADPAYASATCFSPDAFAAARKAIQQQGCRIVCDTRMIEAGINKVLLARCGGEIACFVDDGEVAAQAAAEGITRSMAAMRRAVRLFPEGIYVIGNAPTALFELLHLVEGGLARPALVIGVPVGFVGAAESKEALLQAKLPAITVQGHKGGSTVAVAIVNALLKLYL
jgi:precorrin-8X/cobalt-precorrin-8 methylmutase